MRYYILKQFIEGGTAWVVQLNATDKVYSYWSLTEAQNDLPRVQGFYPNRGLKIEILPANYR